MSFAPPTARLASFFPPAQRSLWTAPDLPEDAEAPRAASPFNDDPLDEGAPTMPPTPLIRHMDQLFQRADPWNYRTSPYEIRKRAVTLACLPQWRYASAFEPGCANGVLSEQLLTRCDALLCADASLAALRRAAEQVGDRPGLSWRQMTVPDEWPDERFDLIVLSELMYYLDLDACHQVAERCLSSLRPGGTLLACHWRHAADDFQCTGEGAHAALREVFNRAGVMGHMRMHRERDFLIDVWTKGRAPQAEPGAAP